VGRFGRRYEGNLSQYKNKINQKQSVEAKMCAELHATTEQKCVDCSKWLHELCTMYDDRCNSCGKQFIRENKKNK
jgi:hypothetical protein